MAIVSMGYAVGQSLRAADVLASRGIEATVIDMFTLKPFDKQAVIDAAKRTGKIITVENHYINNGLGLRWPRLFVRIIRRRLSDLDHRINSARLEKPRSSRKNSE